MRVFTFLVLEILMLPVSVTGYVLATAWAIAISQQQHISITALSPLSIRWIMQQQGTRPDPAVTNFVKHLPSVNGAFCLMSVAPTLLATTLSHYNPFAVPVPGNETLFNMMSTRSVFFDRALANALKNGAEQVVVLGAGFDTRLANLCLKNNSSVQNIALFEVDQPAIQQVKVNALQQCDFNSDKIRFVAVNFNQESWTEKLVEAGFVMGKKTFFLWEGVTYYLTQAVVQKSLQMMADISGTGSEISFDFFSQRLLDGNDLWWLRLGTVVLDWIGEPFLFGVPLHTAKVKQFAASETTASETTASEILTASMFQTSGFQISQLQLMGSSIPEKAFGGLVVAQKV